MWPVASLWRFGDLRLAVGLRGFGGQRMITCQRGFAGWRAAAGLWAVANR